MQHSSLGASNSHRWLPCPGSVAAEEPFPNTTSAAAAEGTEAHSLGELALRTSDAALNSYANQEMAEYVRIYTDYVRSIPGKLVIEHKVSYTDWVPGGFGTADAIVLGDGVITVVDLKFGYLPVEVENNPQAMLYALGALSVFGLVDDYHTIRMAIVQPRLDRISEWETTTEELLKWADWVAERAKLTQEPDAPRVPGESQCRFCRASASCPALAKAASDAIMADFEDLDLVPPRELTDAQMATALTAKTMIDGWFGAISKLVTERLEAGGSFTGFKLVEGRGSRKWGPDTEGDVADMLGDDAYKHTLVSPAQAEKIVGKSGKAALDKLVVRQAGKPTLAPESDKRRAINLQETDFSVVDD